jgi:hypothetical protein
MRTNESLDFLRERDGHLYIEVSHCVHCERLMLAPITDECVCGAETYPVTKLVPLGKAVAVEEMLGG